MVTNQPDSARPSASVDNRRPDTAIRADALVRAWRMGYLAACHDPSDEAVVRANLKASEEGTR